MTRNKEKGEKGKTNFSISTTQGKQKHSVLNQGLRGYLTDLERALFVYFEKSNLTCRHMELRMLTWC